MAGKDPLKSLRDQVRKRRSAVTAKENRIKRNTGVDIRNTPEDPRRPIDVVDKYNRKQLAAYLSKLDSFMSRSVGYKAGIENAPIPNALWNRYKNLEKQYNDIGAKKFDAIKDINIDFAGMTIAERERRMVPDSKMAQNEIVHRPYGFVDRKVSNIKSAEALEKIIAGMESKLDKNYEKSQLDAGRKQLNQMLDSFGHTGADLKKAVADLSDHQFNVLWNYTPFAQTVSTIAPSGSRRQKNVKNVKNDRYSATVENDMRNDMKVILDWTTNLPDGSSTYNQKLRAKNPTRRSRKR